MKRLATKARHRLMAALLLSLPSSAHAQQTVFSGTLRIVGAHLEVQAPASVPIKLPIELPTALRAGDGSLGDAATLFPGQTVEVHGELSGPGLTGAVDLPAVAPGTPLQLPPLSQPGNYVVDNLRLTDAAGNTLLPAIPSVVSLKALEKVIVTAVNSRPLSLEEIQDRGIVIDSSNYTGGR